jgi:hypothetical protein
MALLLRKPLLQLTRPKTNFDGGKETVYFCHVIHRIIAANERCQNRSSAMHQGNPHTLPPLEAAKIDRDMVLIGLHTSTTRVVVPNEKEKSPPTPCNSHASQSLHHGFFYQP